jgi:hypothetical protein
MAVQWDFRIIAVNEYIGTDPQRTKHRLSICR